MDKEQAMSNIISTVDALDTAMKRELGAVLYYQEIQVQQAAGQNH